MHKSLWIFTFSSEEKNLSKDASENHSEKNKADDDDSEDEADSEDDDSEDSEVEYLGYSGVLGMKQEDLVDTTKLFIVRLSASEIREIQLLKRKGAEDSAATEETSRLSAQSASKRVRK